jgi:hypothetical protein
MVRINIGGLPNISIDEDNPSESIREARTTIRRRMKGQGVGRINFEWRTIQPRLVLTSDTDDFDEKIIAHFQAEGFQISYLAYNGDRKQYTNALNSLAGGLELGDRYAIVAYGDAASLCLDACTKPMPKLVAVVAYYPPYMPNSTTNFPPTLSVLVHLAANQKFGTRLPSFRYQDTVDGFAEHDLDEYDRTAAGLAWSRTLGVLRRSFDLDGEVDLEAIWDNHTRLEFETKSADQTMKTMVSQPYVNHVPTMTGGIGAKDLRRFYHDYFIPGNPESLKIKLLSRTVGSDRIVDEMLCTFRHTCEVPWMLPGIPPTDKEVEVVLVSVVCIRGGKLYHEHIHWDQATVLVQVGLLDPKHIPQSFKTAEKGREKEVKQLPVVGREGARKVVDEREGESNLLIPDWKNGKEGQRAEQKKVGWQDSTGKGKQKEGSEGKQQSEQSLKGKQNTNEEEKGKQQSNDRPKGKQNTKDDAKGETAED